MILKLTPALLFIFVMLAMPPAASQTTRGEIMDRHAAADVERCAKQYLGRQSSGANTDVWLMCLHVSAELAERDKVNVARQVIRQQRYNVFEVEEKPGLFSRSPGPNELTPEMIERLSTVN